MPDPFIILGAGLAGLTCARALGRDYRLYERENKPGGTARTSSRSGFLFDVTGHWLHLRNEGIRSLVNELLGDSLLRIERRAAIYSHGVLTPYPFQANTYGLPDDVRSACILGYFRARETQARGDREAPRNFEEYVRAVMGDGIAEHFMLPYNRKLWTIDPAEMSHRWCERFVPVPTPEEVVHGALRPAGAGHRMGYNPILHYPDSDGIERLASALHASLATPAHTGVEALAIDWQRRTVRFSGKPEEPYRVLISSLPLDRLTARLVDPPPGVHRAAAVLRAASVTYWDIGVARPNHPDDPHWIYFPQKDLPFYRVGSASAAVPYVAPSGHRSYYVEVAHPQGQPCPVNEENLLAGLRRVGLLLPNERPVLMEKNLVPCAYVIMDQSYGSAREQLLTWLASQNILSIGRYGDWTYDSMEGAMLAGQRAAGQAQQIVD